MNLRQELIALGVRVIAERTRLIQKPDDFSSFLTYLINGETYDKTLARNIEAEAARAAAALKERRASRPKRTIFPFKQ